jgi:hypothetical protein
MEFSEGRQRQNIYIQGRPHFRHIRRISSHTKRKEIVRGNQGTLNKAMDRIEQIKTLINILMFINHHNSFHQDLLLFIYIVLIVVKLPFSIDFDLSSDSLISYVL